MIKFSAPLESVPFPRPAQNGKRRFNPTRYSNFKAALGLFARQAMNGRAPLSGAIRISVDVFKKIIPTALKFGDWDNHGKSISDALNGICYIDDKQIIDGHIRLHKGDPLIIIELEALS